MVSATNIPIELLGIMVAMAFIFVIIGISKKIGIIVTIGGLFVMILGLLTLNAGIIMGSQVATSTLNTTSGTTSYTYQNTVFQFQYWHAILFCAMGAFIMLSGVLVSKP